MMVAVTLQQQQQQQHAYRQFSKYSSRAEAYPCLLKRGQCLTCTEGGHATDKHQMPGCREDQQLRVLLSGPELT